MIEIDIDCFGKLRIEHLVLDYNGTLAVDGVLLPGVAEKLVVLSARLRVHVLTADTFGVAAAGLTGIPCRLSVLSPETQDEAKAAYIQDLGPEKTICIGNGRNDRRMLQQARLGIATLGGEGAAVEALLAAKVVVTDILAALDLLLQPLRLVATLRS